LQVGDLEHAAAFYEQDVPILAERFDGPFGRTFVLRDPDGYAVTIHQAR